MIRLFECRNSACKARLHVSPQSIGKRIVCPKCGTIQLASARTTPIADPQKLARDDAKRKSQRDLTAEVPSPTSAENQPVSADTRDEEIRLVPLDDERGASRHVMPQFLRKSNSSPGYSQQQRHESELHYLVRREAAGQELTVEEQKEKSRLLSKMLDADRTRCPLCHARLEADDERCSECTLNLRTARIGRQAPVIQVKSYLDTSADPTEESAAGGGMSAIVGRMCIGAVAGGLLGSLFQSLLSSGVDVPSTELWQMLGPGGGAIFGAGFEFFRSLKSE